MGATVWVDGPGCSSSRNRKQEKEAKEKRMLTETAVKLINDTVAFLPGWTVKAKDFTSRHEGCICLYVSYPGRESNRPEAMDGYPVQNEPRATFLLQVAELDDIGLHKAVLDRLIEFITHEFREFYRVKPSYWSPFHPHSIDGMRRWGDADRDLQFGFNGMDWDKELCAPVPA
jgi:hypothetical protein